MVGKLGRPHPFADPSYHASPELTPLTWPWISDQDLAGHLYQRTLSSNETVDEFLFGLAWTVWGRAGRVGAA